MPRYNSSVLMGSPLLLQELCRAATVTPAPDSTSTSGDTKKELRKENKELERRADGLVTPRCRAASRLVLVTFVVAVAVTGVMLVQTLFGSSPRGYPMLALVFPVALLFTNLDMLRMLFNMYLPGITNKVLYFAVLSVQVLAILLTGWLDVGSSWIARLFIAGLLAAQVTLMVVLFKRKASYDASTRGVQCSITARIREVLERAGAFAARSTSSRTNDQVLLVLQALLDTMHKHNVTDVGSLLIAGMCESNAPSTAVATSPET